MAMIAAVLAGGASRRMGEPKAALVLDGRALLQRAVDAATEAGLRPVVVAKPGMELPDTGAQRLDEPAEPRHPLTGILVALAAAGPEGLVALACDTPFLPPGLLAALAARDELTFVRTPDGRHHPLPGRYPQLELLAEHLARRAPLHRLPAALLDWPDAAALLNLNAPEDLRRARMPGAPDGA